MQMPLQAPKAPRSGPLKAASRMALIAFFSFQALHCKMGNDDKLNVAPKEADTVSLDSTRHIAAESSKEKIFVPPPNPEELKLDSFAKTHKLIFPEPPRLLR